MHTVVCTTRHQTPKVFGSVAATAAVGMLYACTQPIMLRWHEMLRLQDSKELKTCTPARKLISYRRQCHLVISTVEFLLHIVLAPYNNASVAAAASHLLLSPLQVLKLGTWQQYKAGSVIEHRIKDEPRLYIVFQVWELCCCLVGKDAVNAGPTPMMGAGS